MLRSSMLFTSMFVLAALTVARGQQVKFDNVDGVILAQKPCVLVRGSILIHEAVLFQRRV